MGYLDNAGLVRFYGAMKARFATNRNLLNNWDFRNPVNQRGQTSYTTNGYTIDCWRSYNSAVITVGTGGVTVAYPGAASHKTLIEQKIENPEQYAGLSMTFSARFKNVSGAVRLLIGDSGTTGSGFLTGDGMLTVTRQIPANATALRVSVMSGAAAACTATLIAVKLELGSISTLEYDPPADYGEELRKCQRYFVRLKGTDASNSACMGDCFCVTPQVAFAFIPTPVPLRTLPVCTVSGLHIGDGTYYSDEVAYNYVHNCTHAGVELALDGEFTPGAAARLYVGTSGYLDLSADL